MMTYREFLERDRFALEDLLAFAYGSLVKDPPEHFDARLPAPPFLMIDRILSVKSDGKRGSIVAEQDVRLDAWFFQCHMPGDPVQPGCLSLDAIWQMMGFYCVWRGARGAGRALGCGEVEFSGQVRPRNRVIRYEVDIKRYAELKASGAAIAAGDGRVFVDGELIARIAMARTGIFRGIVYGDYPNPSANSVGGTIREGEGS